MSHNDVLYIFPVMIAKLHMLIKQNANKTRIQEYFAHIKKKSDHLSLLFSTTVLTITTILIGRMSRFWIMNITITKD